MYRGRREKEYALFYSFIHSVCHIGTDSVSTSSPEEIDTPEVVQWTETPSSHTSRSFTCGIVTVKPY